MNEEVNEISNGYRNSRRNTSILSAIGIAWTAAQFEVKTLSFGALGSVNLEKASIHILIIILCAYSMTKCTIEYMMQSKPVRRWPLAQLDYKITLYISRFAIVALAASSIERTWAMIFYVACFFLIFALSFVILSFMFMLIVMPIRIFIRKLSGRISVASASIEATYYSFTLSGLTLIIIVVLVGFNIINPFLYLDVKYQAISNTNLIFFSGIFLSVIVSFFFDEKFLNMIFAFEPKMIEQRYHKDGIEYISIVPNPNHPEHKQLNENKHLKDNAKQDS